MHIKEIYDFKLHRMPMPDSFKLGYALIRYEKDMYEVYNLYTGRIYRLKKSDKIPDEYIMQIPCNMEGSILKAFIELATEQNVKDEDESVIKGKYEATKYHLEDMRKMLKLK